MENIILTNNKDLRLVSVKVGVLSTLRFELPLVSASATHVEVIVTSGDVHSAYTATFIEATKRWQCDIAASQFPAVGKQSYEVAYVLDGKQFWDGKGWIEIEDATTSGIEPQPRPEPYRYAVVSVNGYGADAQGAVRIPKTFIATNSPMTTEDYMEGDIYFNRLTGATWTLCDVQDTLTWVFNYSNYYTKTETDEQIDKLAAYYITSDVQGNPFATRAALLDALAYYSGGELRVPTRNDYAVVLADETHDNAEYRYIYAVPEGQTTGSWQPQYPVEGVMTVDPTVTKGSQNPVSGGGVWSAIWGALAALPTGFSSLYDWCVAQLAGKADKSDVDPLLFAQYYPDGSVKSAAEFTSGIKYDAPDTTNRTITVKPFCNTGTAANDNSSLVGRVVIPPFVDAQGNPYISDDGTRFKVVGVSDGLPDAFSANLTAIVAPSTVATIGDRAFGGCTSLASVSLPAATTIGDRAFNFCTALTSVSLPAATSIRYSAFSSCTSLASVDFGATPRPSVPTLGADAFSGVHTTCKIIVPYTQYDAWIAADGWKDLPQEFVRHAEKADKPATFTAGNLAALDAQGNPTDSGVKPSAKLDCTSAAPAFSSDSSTQYAVGAHVTYNGKLYVCTTATTGGTWVAGSWAEDTMTDPDAVLDITAQNQLRVVAKDGTLLWAQGYDLASTSSATLACDATNNFTFADGATTQAFALPTAPTGKVGDFGLDIDNSANTGAATITLTGLDTTFSVVVPKGESLNDMLAIAAGELAQFYITLSTFRVNNLPTWHIVKQVVENGGATV